MTPLEQKLGHSFSDPALLARALTHAGANSANSNERLEFLGDRVLALVVAQTLYQRYPEEDEGALTRRVHSLVRWEACARIGEAVGLWDHVVLTRSEAAYIAALPKVTERLLNAPGTAHGGVMMALVDVVHAAVSNSHGTLAVAQDVHTEFLNAGSLGDTMVCEGVEINRTGRTAVYRIDVHSFGETYPDGRHIATALARVFRLGKPWITEPDSDVAGA